MALEEKEEDKSPVEEMVSAEDKSPVEEMMSAEGQTNS